MQAATEKTIQVRKVLNVGGHDKRIGIPDCYAGWQHDLLDIDPATEPDLCCDARLLANTPPRVYDSIYCSHNLEHYYWHELPSLLRGFRLVLKKDGFAYIRVPDLRAVIEEVVRRELDLQDVLYHSPAGPIKVHDVIYGLGAQMERSGNDYFAHKCGFTEKSLTQLLASSGFPHIYTGAGQLEIAAFAFAQEPTAYHRQLLDLP